MSVGQRNPQQQAPLRRLGELIVQCEDRNANLRYGVDDWLNNDNLKDQLATDLTTLLYDEGYPPDWDEEVFHRVLEQMENYKRHQN